MGSPDELGVGLMEAATLDDKRKAMAKQEEQLQVKIERLQAYLGVIQTINKLLSVRVFAFLSLFAAIALFSWAAIEPDVGRTVAVSVYSVLVFFPSLWWTRQPKEG